MRSRLEKYIEQELQIDSKNVDLFVAQFELRNLSKGEYFLRNGDFCKQIAFINKGAMYCVYNKEGIDKIDEFSFENDFITDYLSILTQAPADKDIVCLENCEILVANTQKLNDLYQQHPIFERIGRLMAEGLFINWHLKAKSLFMDDAETRYRNLIALRPDLPQRVPQYLVASYLNVTPETLSRIRKKIASKQQ
jgi:CRP-like cAMP-binding protein